MAAPETRRTGRPTTRPSDDTLALHARLLDDLGGPKEIANGITRLTGEAITQQAVGKWRARGIPWYRRRDLALLAAERGVDLPPGFFAVARAA